MHNQRCTYRICLEEDALSNLETPCGCTGTQRHAHKECIQKWVNEKHHTTCEICDQPYKGEGQGWACCCCKRWMPMQLSYITSALSFLL